MRRSRGRDRPHSIRWSTRSADCSARGILIACGNERGNIEKVILRMPRFGRAQEILFVGGDSSDFKECERVRNGYKGAVLKQDKGKVIREEHYPNRDDYRHV
jgi:hypothetical protein